MGKTERIAAMIQFTQEEQRQIKERARQYPEIIRKLKDNVRQVMEEELLVPEEGVTDWSLYYYCSECSVKLIFDRKSPKRHICPCCGRVFQGEPYDGAWWELVNGQNNQAAYEMAVIWLAEGDEAYGQKAIQILEAYARYYPNYQVHGNIPYNGPGRAGAQTLDEANFLRTMAFTYDILADMMPEDIRDRIRDRMLLPGAQFLLEHRHRQLHNHEVIINSAIAVMGILFSKEEYVKAALYEPYGLLYQLEHGMTEENLWFEGTFGYHFYALTSFFAFEKFALHTPYSNIHHPNYRAMMEAVLDYLQPDGGIPMMNDTNFGHLPRIRQLYEFACRELGGEKLAYILQTLFHEDETVPETRDNLDAFLYGVPSLPESCGSFPASHYHTEVGKPGHTVLRGRDGRYLLFKHDRYGGEHDHYDRLGISYISRDCPAAKDLGTTGYGAKLHYDYYKNTGTHNTMVIGEENQAPVDGKLTRYEERYGVVYVEAKADWTAPYEMPDTFTITQWSEECYRSVVMERKLAWTENYFVEVFLARQIPEGKTADWVFHVDGREEPDENPIQVKALENYFVKKPFCHLKNVKLTRLEAGGTYQKTYRQQAEGEKKGSSSHLTIWGMKKGQLLVDALGPDNPSSEEISYIIERERKENVLTAHVIESWKDAPTVKHVRFEQDGERSPATSGN